MRQPFEEIPNFGVAPHPRGKPLKGLLCLCSPRRSAPVDELVYVVGILPVGFDSNHREAFLFDQAACDACALAIELACAMGGFAEEYEPILADEGQERIVVLRRSTQRFGRSGDSLDCRVHRNVAFRGNRTAREHGKTADNADEGHRRKKAFVMPSKQLQEG